MGSAFYRSRGFGELLRELARGGADLVRGEFTLARLELSDLAARMVSGTAQIAFGGVLLLLGGLSLAAGLILLVGDQWLPGDRYWVAALITMTVSAVLAYGMVRRGRARFSAAILTPTQTLETLEEDKEWLKRQRTSGAT